MWRWITGGIKGTLLKFKYVRVNHLRCNNKIITNQEYLCISCIFLSSFLVRMCDVCSLANKGWSYSGFTFVRNKIPNLYEDTIDKGSFWLFMAIMTQVASLWAGENICCYQSSYTPQPTQHSFDTCYRINLQKVPKRNMRHLEGPSKFRGLSFLARWQNLESYPEYRKVLRSLVIQERGRSLQYTELQWQKICGMHSVCEWM